MDGKNSTRTIQECVYRKVLSGENGNERSSDCAAICGLLSDISGVEEHSVLNVPVAACQACCNSHLPSKTDPNSVVASLLVGMTEQIISSGGLPNCTVQKATELALWAEKCLPAVSFDEDDTKDIANKNYQHLASIETDAIERLLPIPAELKSSTWKGVQSWAVGVTTSPRRLPTLESCVHSVIQAGWTEPVLFLDGEVELPTALSGLNYCRRVPAVGAFPNYVLSLSELYMRDPNADAYLLIQDDAIFVPSNATKSYLEKVLWPYDGPCIASLYCSKKYEQVNAGWHLFPGKWVWGAVAFAFSNAAAKQTLSDPALLAHRAQPGRDGLSKIDVVLGQIASTQKIPLIFPSPSLVQHIGTISTIWEYARAVNARHASQFIGDLIEQP